MASWTCVAVVILAASLRAVTALPQCGSETVNIPGANKLSFAVVGDWGRQGGQDSLFNPKTVQGCIDKGTCCSSLQRADLDDVFDFTDIINAPQQKLTATLLNEVCGTEGCQFILGMGDNFYPCGADAYDTGLNRFVSDWQQVYQTDSMPHIRDLAWYHVVGNHDHGFDTSVNLQLAYAKSNPQWVFPSNYYARTFVAGDVSMQVEFLDETPFIGTYVHPKTSKAYFTDYLATKVTPAYINSDAAAYLNKTTGYCNIPPANASFITNISDSATGQIPWLKSCLESSNATWDVISAHFALYGSDVLWAQNTSKSAYPGNCGAFGSLAHLIEEYKVPVYVNGHDHTQTHADPAKAGVMIGEASTYGNVTYLVSGPEPATQYFTLGNGGAIQYADGVTTDSPKDYNDWSDVIYNQNVQYGLDVANAINGEGPNAAVGEGFAIVTADACVMTVRFYNIMNYNPGLDTQPTHTAVIDKCGTASI